MLPSLRPGQIVICSRMIKKLRTGHVVVIRHEGLEKIKRISDINDHGFFVLGDNPDLSTDSRDFGRIARENVVAKIVWPRT